MVIRVLTEMIEYGCKIEEKVKAMQSEIKKSVQGTNSEGKETGTQINDLEQKEEINIQPEHSIKTMRKGLGTSGTTLNVPTSESKGCQKEERKSKKLKASIMKENFPNLAKEIDFQEVQEAQRVPKNLDPRKHTPRHIIITLPKMKDQERILTAAREKETVTYKVP